MINIEEKRRANRNRETKIGKYVYQLFHNGITPLFISLTIIHNIYGFVKIDSLQYIVYNDNGGKNEESVL